MDPNPKPTPPPSPTPSPKPSPPPSPPSYINNHLFKKNNNTKK